MYADPHSIEDNAAASINCIACCIQQCVSTLPYNLTPTDASIFWQWTHCIQFWHENTHQDCALPNNGFKMWHIHGKKYTTKLLIRIKDGGSSVCDFQEEGINIACQSLFALSAALVRHLSSLCCLQNNHIIPHFCLPCSSFAAFDFLPLHTASFDLSWSLLCRSTMRSHYMNLLHIEDKLMISINRWINTDGRISSVCTILSWEQHSHYIL